MKTDDIFNFLLCSKKQKNEELRFLTQFVRIMKYYELIPEKNHFESIFVDLTHRCNMKCRNCYLPNRKVPDMDKNKLYQLIERLPKKVFIRLIGAEPTLREDLPEIIYQIIKLGHKPSVITNGLKLAEEDYCQQLRQSGLKYLLISMNGAGDDKIYFQLDGGNYAKLKVRALINAFKADFLNVNTGTIIGKGINEKTIREQVNTVVFCAKQAGVRYFNKRVPPVLRVKTIAPIGRHMKSVHSYTFNDLLEVTSQQLNLSVDFIKSYPVLSGSNKLEYLKRNKKQLSRSYAFPYDTEIGKIYVRLIDWTVDLDGVPDSGNTKRGRVTENWRIAPAFEHIKINEGGY